MESLNQFDVQNPDHVSVITRDGKVTVSVMKDGTSVTIGFPVHSPLNTKPRPVMQQDGEMALIKKITTGETPRVKATNPTKTPKAIALINAKLNEADVREIKGILATPSIMAEFRSTHHAYKEIGKAYNVSYHTISNIHRGKSWVHVNV